MPIYEYRCKACSRKSAIFFRSISLAEEASSNVRCPRCGGQELRRLFSRFAMGKSTSSEGEEIYDFDRMMAGLETDDPRSVARWARKMGQESGMGEELGPEFDEALNRIEAGEDPEAVMTELDPAAEGGAEEGQ
ncbi:MAG: zinc ribbon domain-containing protein [Chloroflexota bacterium]|nr:zinc ribbon domain-containing protein [Chloroflexota bacterium]